MTNCTANRKHRISQELAQVKYEERKHVSNIGKYNKRNKGKWARRRTTSSLLSGVVTQVLFFKCALYYFPRPTTIFQVAKNTASYIFMAFSSRIGAPTNRVLRKL